MAAASFEAIAREIGEKVRANGHGEGADQPWPLPDMALLRPHRHRAPELPLAPFGAWGRWIADAAEAKGAPTDFVALALIVTAGGLVANSRRASPWPGWVEPPILWGAALGLPSSGKSPALDAVVDLVRALVLQSGLIC